MWYIKLEPEMSGILILPLHWETFPTWNVLLGNDIKHKIFSELSNGHGVIR